MSNRSFVDDLINRPLQQSPRFYAFARGVVYLVNRLYFGNKVYFEAPLPSSPFVLAPTHRSYIDTPLVGSILKEPLRYMAKSELWKNPWLGRLIELLGGFPVDRSGADRNSLNTALEILRAGESLVVFPEGERRSGEKVEKIHEGVAYLSLKTKVPVVPVAFYGSDHVLPPGSKFPRRGRVRSIVGKAMYPSSYVEDTSGKKSVPRRAIVAMTNDLELTLQRLFDEAKSL
ncbi:1-acyl-sn-glycerol-3-phosphate acyltransferase [Ferrithrix thermotolerans DSM 19514]|uniref:1-acyl-sn-glycerol-3-phosphate acyltransferase n=1 Tax=Ferrithrix thermotolerans DSM 19514 TaxID=1121881 RepID=A0A1M4WFP8_9ACTN|nr:lysophospholipid acyltransferase family protein [Ferrithrix thermotolerans]SHE80015.1 1-acyl-sn-glycerol-3-phosphate acyltransferase [Ferrithrix thermotolerans DSM 19514]